MNTYNAAIKIKNYLLKRWAEDIAFRDGDKPRVFSKSKLEKTGMRNYTGGDGSAIIWEGFYEWTKSSEIKKMEEIILRGTNLRVSSTSEWLIEILEK